LLGVELAATNRFGEAAASFKEVTRLRPEYAQAQFNLGVALAKGGDINGAFAAFRKTLEIDPGHKLAREYVAAIENASSKAQHQN
jgi:Flp pilus assembly protein TadD